MNSPSPKISLHVNGLDKGFLSADEASAFQYPGGDRVVYDEYRHLYADSATGPSATSLAALGLQRQVRRVYGILLANCERVISLTQAAHMLNRPYLSIPTWKNAKSSIAKLIRDRNLTLTIESDSRTDGPAYVLRRNGLTIVAILVHPGC